MVKDLKPLIYQVSIPRLIAKSAPNIIASGRVAVSPARASNRSAVGSQTYTISYGGQTLTRANGDNTSTTPRQHSAIYYLKEAGIAEFVIASTGNVAISYSAYAARASIKLYAFLTSLVPSSKMREVAIYGTQVIKITGSYDQTKQVAARFANQRGIPLDLGARSISCVESMKTIAFEVAEQLGWRAPDCVVVPMAGRNTTQARAIGHVGDSRLYLVRNASPTILTNDHTTVGDLVRMRVLPPEKVRKHAHRSILTRGVGLTMIVKPDVSQVQLQEDDCLILCSDGLWSVIEDAEFAHLASKNNSAAHLGQSLIDLALDLCVPPLAGVAVVAFVGSVLAAWASWHLGRPMVAPWVWGGSLAGMVVYVLRGWVLSGTGARGLTALAHAPIYAFWKMALSMRRRERSTTAWVRTDRERRSG